MHALRHDAALGQRLEGDEGVGARAVGEAAESWVREPGEYSLLAELGNAGVASVLRRRGRVRALGLSD
eukprot:3784133-Rhodomonas_salina.4